MSRTILRILNGIYGWTLGSVLLAAAVYSVFSLWDNSQIYQAVQNVQEQMRELRPEAQANSPDFGELQAVNEDVIAWITVDGTNVDHPLLQGDNNMTYMNRDVYGKFSLAGSIFLDTRNSAKLTDSYSLIYGHNMDEHLMFGDLALFKDRDFFSKNTEASLTTPKGTLDLKVAAILQLSAGTEEIFNPLHWSDTLNGFGSFLEAESIWYHEDIIKGLKADADSYQVFALVTCSEGNTNDRTILILVYKKPEQSQEKDPAPDDSKPEDEINGNGPKKTGDHNDANFWIEVIIGTVIFIVCFETAERLLRKRRGQKR